MRYLGLDLGTKTLGIAISDKTNIMSSSLKVLRYSNGDYLFLINELRKIIEKYEISTLVLGYPKNMNNSLGEAAERVEKFKSLLEENLNINVVLIDERLSTVEAENILISNDMRRKKRKKIIDGVAAMVILDTYLRKKGNE
jgi:putative holliday junction resolvase